MTRQKRKVCFVITSFIHYSRNFLILEELKKREDVELYIILGGVVLLERYASTSYDIKDILRREGYENIYEAYFNVDGDGPIIKAKTVGLGVNEFATLFHQIKPDIVLVRGDRFEVLSAAIAAVNMNLLLAHIEGGDVSGTIDESIRHAITKLAHIHFVTNAPAYERVVRMGEDPKYVFNFGSPDIEVVHSLENIGLTLKNLNLKNLGSGNVFNPTEPYILVMYHPVSTEISDLSRNTKNILAAVHELGIQAIWFWPNFDAGAEYISHEMRAFNNNTERHKIRFMRYVPPKEFLTLLSNAQCLVGNSSSGIKECSYLGIPVVDIGSRQHNRLVADNVVHSSSEKEDILKNLRKQIEVGRYPQSKLYSATGTSFNIAKILAETTASPQKVFCD